MKLPRFRRLALPCVSLLLAPLAQRIDAATVTSTWLAAASGAWNDATKWDTNPIFPNNAGPTTYDAIINAVGFAYTVNLNTSVTVEDLLMSSANATLSHTSGTFTATGAISLNAGTYSLAGGTISNTTINVAGGSLTVTANTANLLNAVTVNGDLNLNVTSAATRIGGGTTFTTARLAASSAELGFAPGSTLTGTALFEGANFGTGHVNVTAAGAFTIGPTGIIRTEPGTNLNGEIGQGFNYSGAMALNNQGLISSQVSARTLTVAPNTLNNTGTMEAKNGGILSINPATTWTNAGTIGLDASSTVNLGGTFDATGGIGTWANTAAGTVNINGTITNTASTLTLNNSTGSWTLSGGTINGGSLAFADGKTLLIAANSANLLAGVAVGGALTLNTSGARTRLDTAATFTTARLAASSAELGFAPGSTLTGTALFEGANFGTGHVNVTAAGAFTIGPTGIIRTEPGTNLNGEIGQGFNYSGAMALNNQGLISSQVSARTLTVAPNTLNNTGTMEAKNGGILSINPATTWTNAGTIGLDASSTVNLGGTFDATGGIGTWANTAAGTVNINGTITNTASTLTLNNSTGSWTLSGGTINGGSLAFADGKTLLIAANSANLLAGVAVGGALTLNTSGARTRLDTAATFTTARLAASSAELGFAPGSTLTGTALFEGANFGTGHVNVTAAGAFTIGPTGIIRTEPGTNLNGEIGQGFNYSGAMALNNQGLISSQVSARTLTVAPASLANTGTIEASNGGNLSITSANWTSSAGATLQALSGSTLSLAGNWTNGGALTVNNSTLNLGGTFTTAGINLAGFTNTGTSAVNVTGALNNAGDTLALSNSTGSWTLSGGTINGGSLAFADGKTLLIAANSANLLAGVAVGGALTLNTSGARTRLDTAATFTTARLAASSAELGFAPGSTLTGTALFEGANFGTGHVNVTAAGAFTIGPTGIIRTEPGTNLNGEIGQGFNYSGAMALNNQGLISSQVSARTLTVAPASLANTGTIEASNGGNLSITSANWTSSAGATLQALSGSTLSLAGNWTNGGALTVNNSTLNLGGTFTTAGINLAGFTNTGTSAVNVTGALNNAGDTLALNNSTGSWTLSGGTINGGSLAFADGKTLLIAANSANLLAGVAVGGALTLNTSGARTRLDTAATFTTARLAASSAELGFAPGSTLTGTALFEGANFGTGHVNVTAAGAFTIGPTGIIRTEPGTNLNGEIGQGFNYSGAMALNNQGLISSQVSARTLTVAPASLANTGTIEASNGGNLSITSANWTSSAGATLQALSGSTLSLAGNWTNGGALTVNNSTLNLGGTFTTAGINLAGFTNTGTSAVNVTGALNNAGDTLALNNSTGSWTLSGGTINGGSLAFADGKTLLIAANSANLLAGVAVGGALTLNTSGARTRLDTAATFTTARLAASSAELGFAPGSTLTGTALFEGANFGTGHVNVTAAGAFTIGPTGIIRTEPGTNLNGEIGQGFNYSGAMALNNQGLISSQVSARTLTVAPFSLVQTGIFEAKNGGILNVPGGYTQTGGITRLDNGTVSAGSFAPFGTIFIASGRLEGRGTVTGNVTNSDTIAPGVSPGTLAINGDLTLNGTAKLEIEIGGTAQGTQYDLLSEAGTVPLTLGGELLVSFINGFQSSVLTADSFTIVTSNAAINGAFSNVIGGRVFTADGAGSFAVTVSGNNVILGAFVVPEPSTAALLTGGLLLFRRRRTR